MEYCLSTNLDMQPVGSNPFHKCRPQYMCNLANDVNEVIYKTPHSSPRILTEDIFCLVDCTEKLGGYFKFNQNAYSLLVQMVGQYFERSPNEKKTQLPLMILTNTKSILLRRIKRLKKLQKDEFSSGSSTSQEISFSKSFIPNSRDDYLQSRISQKSFSSCSQVFSSAASKCSKYCIFNPVYSNGQNNLNANLIAIAQNLRQSSSRIKMLSVIDPQQKQLTAGIKTATQSDLNHLILRYGSGEGCGSGQKIFQGGQLSQEQREGGSRGLGVSRGSGLPRTFLSKLPVQVRSRVSKELQKYSWVGGMGVQSSMQSKSKKRVRQKAEEMLRDMGVVVEK